MTWYDSFFLVLVLGYGVIGFSSGALKSVTGVLGLVIASWAAGSFYATTALSLIKSHEGLSQEMAKVQAYGTIWVGVYIAYLIISTIIIHALHVGGAPKAPSRAAGAVLGIIKGVFLVTLAMIFIFEYTPEELSSARKDIETNSKVYPIVKPFMGPVKGIVYSVMTAKWAEELQLPPDMLEGVEKRMKEQLNR